MGKRELTGKGDYAPEPTLVLAKNAEPIKGVFTGEWMGLKQEAAVGAFKNKHIHVFGYHSSTLPIEIKQGDKYIPVALDANEQVIVFANEKLHNAFMKAEKGMVLTIESKGKALNEKTKRYFYDYSVSVEE